MLRIDVRELRKGPVEVSGAIAAQDPLLAGLEVTLLEPLVIAGVLEPTGNGGFFWHGRLDGRVRGACRRCLVDVDLPVTSRPDVLFSADEQLQDDPSVYALPDAATHVELRNAIREEFALAIPAFVVCRDDCRGLCALCGQDLNEGPCECGAPAPS